MRPVSLPGPCLHGISPASRTWKHREGTQGGPGCRGRVCTHGWLGGAPPRTPRWGHRPGMKLSAGDCAAGPLLSNRRSLQKQAQSYPGRAACAFANESECDLMDFCFIVCAENASPPGRTGSVCCQYAWAPAPLIPAGRWAVGSRCRCCSWGLTPVPAPAEPPHLTTGVPAPCGCILRLLPGSSRSPSCCCGQKAVRWHRSPGPRSALSARHWLCRTHWPLTLPEATRSAGTAARLGSAELLVLKEKPNGLELFVLSDTQRAEPHAEAEVFMAHKEHPFHLQCLKSSFRATCGTVLHAACPNTLCNSHNKKHIKEHQAWRTNP